MPPRMDDIMRICCELSADQHMKAAEKSSLQLVAMVAVAGAFAGGLMAGLTGIALGAACGAVGGLLKYWVTGRQFRSLPQILMELPPEQKQRLYNNVSAVLGSLVWTEWAQLYALVMGNATLKQQVTSSLHCYFTWELGAEVQYGE